jgi:predicted ester cyclase
VSEEEKNKALVRRYLEARAQGDLDAIEEMLAPEFVDHSLLPGQEPDRQAYMQWLEESRATLSNVRYIIEDLIAKGDKVITRFTGCATYDQEELLGSGPRGRELEQTGIMIHRISGGKITDEWSEGSGILELAWERELYVARRIQQASLPKEVPALEGWQISPFYRPAREVGGDFYDFHLLSEGRVGLVVGDATGKGVPAALVMATTCGMLQLAAQTLDSSSPGEVLEQVNETLWARIPANMFVTCFYAILDPKSGNLTYANAGHDLPYLRRRVGECEELRARGMPLGLMPGMGYEQKELVLEEGEAALFYSDGVVEAHAPDDEMFGFPKLRALIAGHDEEAPLEALLMEELYSFVGEGWVQEDDITLLTLKRSPSRSRPS